MWVLVSVVLVTTLNCLRLSAASPCVNSENITCFCSDDLVSCNGIQTEKSELESVLHNISLSYSSRELKILNLNVSNLEFQPDGFEFGLLSLETLSVGSGLEHVPSDLFLDLQSTLKNLTLHYNNLDSIDNMPFSMLHNLKYLYLDFNQLNEIPSAALTNLSALGYLSLSGNLLTNIEENILQNLPAIKTLILDNNAIASASNLESSTLTKLSVQNNSLNGTLASSFLQGLPALREVDLSSNKFAAVSPYALSKSHSLLVLNLSGNSIESLDENAFSSLRSLRALDLKDNRITLIKKSSFLNLTSLRNLDLSGNLLEAVLCEYMLDLVSLETVDFRRNKIKTVTPGTFEQSHSLLHLYLDDNQLDCTCQLSHFAMFLINSTVNLNEARANCMSPISDRGTSLIDISFPDENCDVLTVERCSVTFTDHIADEDEYPASTEIGQAHSTTTSFTQTDSESSEFITPTSDLSTTGAVETVTAANERNRTEIPVRFQKVIESTTEMDPSTTNSEDVENETISFEKTDSNHTTESNLPPEAEVTTTEISTTNTFISSKMPMVLPDWTIDILNHSFSDGNICLRWTIGGSLNGLPTCSIEINSRIGRRIRKLKCPNAGSEAQQCLKVQEMYDFCINLDIDNIRKDKCSKDEFVPTTVRSSNTTESPLQKPTNPLTFSVFLDSAKAVAKTVWTVGEMSPQACNVTLKSHFGEFVRVEGTFSCTNNSREIRNLNVNEIFEICLTWFTEKGETSQCRKFEPKDLPVDANSSSSLKASTSISSYKNPPFIASVCLLTIIAIVIIVIVWKQIRKRTESDTYNVHVEENIMHRRVSQHQEQNNRYSYATRETLDL